MSLQRVSKVIEAIKQFMAVLNLLLLSIYSKVNSASLKGKKVCVCEHYCKFYVFSYLYKLQYNFTLKSTNMVH